ncbi:uncharacterized protein LOC106079834 isoform X2 [Biomphalaria glabrata]|nr:uncharacterized protein LOC106079834 isoform X2 [Biomphalaria glabrata]XP_055891356.1 uncharacterized protein LOC106079834 isoform X2 [Biomphalaria glabrata]
METRALKTVKDRSTKNAPVNYPGSGQRPAVRRSIRTPVQVLPLNVEKFASKSYVIPTDQDDKETPRTLIAGFLGPAESQTSSRTLRRRSEKISEFISPRLSDVLKKKVLNAAPSTSESPGSKSTPRTNIMYILAGPEEQTPLEKTSTTTKHQPLESVSSRTKRRRSSWGQRLSISPIQVSKSNTEDSEDTSLVNGRRKTRRSFHFNRNAIVRSTHLLSESNLTIGEKKSFEKSVSKSNIVVQEDFIESSGSNDQQEVNSNRKSVSQNKSPNLDKIGALISSPASEQKYEQLQDLFLSKESSSDVAINEQQVRLHGDSGEYLPNVSSNHYDEKKIERNELRPQQNQNSLSETVLHQGLDSGEEEDLMLQDQVMANVSKPKVSAEAVHSAVAIGNDEIDSDKEVQLSKILSQSNRSNELMKQRNSGRGSKDIQSEKLEVSSISHKKSGTEKDISRSVDHLSTSPMSPQKHMSKEDVGGSLAPFDEPDGATNRSDLRSTSFQEIMSRSSHSKVSKSKTSIRNISLLQAASKEPEPFSARKGLSEYDLMESSSDAEQESKHSKLLRTPKSKKKTLSSRSNITKDELAEKYNSPSRSPGSPYRILRQNNADFRVIGQRSTTPLKRNKTQSPGSSYKIFIQNNSNFQVNGQRSSTPLIRNKSFLHSTKVQEVLPFDLTHNQTHLMENEIRDISPIRPDVRTQRQQNLIEDVPDIVTAETEINNVSNVQKSIGSNKTGHGSKLESRSNEEILHQVNGSTKVNSIHNLENTVSQTTGYQETGNSKSPVNVIQEKTIPRSKRQRLEPDEEDDLPSGYSPINTPVFTATKPPPEPVSIGKQKPRMIQSTLTQAGMLKAVVQPKKANTKSKEISPAAKRMKKATGHSTLPRSSVKFFAERHSSMKLSKDAVDEIVKVSEVFWSDTWKALEAYALHAGRKKINKDDVILLMKTQRAITGIEDLHDKIREYLPMELRTELIPLKL